MRFSGLAFCALRPLSSLAFAPYSLSRPAPRLLTTASTPTFSHQQGTARTQRRNIHWSAASATRVAEVDPGAAARLRGGRAAASVGSLRMQASSAASGEPQKVAALMYQYVDGMLDKRGPYRSAHLALLKTMSDQGSCLLGGAFVEPCDGGIVLFSNREMAQQFVEKDPYNAAGLVTSYKIRDYMAVVGTMMK